MKSLEYVILLNTKLAITHTTKRSMLKSVIYKLGQHPKLSLKRFFIGLGLFALSLLAIAYGYYQHAWVQLIGLGLLAPALFFSGWGYVGIFANRFSQVIVTMHPDNRSADNGKTK